ncbi:hypothetical protein QLQ12_39165 [Actinoplanes sp. NEAU-A12]|uniref:LigA protein n=1 Tax=Actinoplanes sandaracinus TaxID=3045177 RepID=A0ABT6WY66_9ACTN|nr:hypothetical protein [Actinoplanes sandaracinus]MDI6104629.1 hypothetical protein [Actinoplanes sandaracinus]
MTPDPADPKTVPPPQPADTTSATPRRVKEAGDEMAANATQPRKAADTNNLRREAEAVFASGGAYFGSSATVDSVVGRDQIVTNIHVGGTGTATRTTVVYRLDAEQVRLVRDAFVLDQQYAELLGRTRGRNVILLQAARGSGRCATGLRVLLDHHRTEVFGLPPDATPAGLGSAVEQDRGYLIDNLADHRIRELTALALHDLDARLGSLRATLFITVPSGVAFTDPGVQRFVVTLGKPATHRAIVESHLRHRLGTARADRLLREHDLGSVLDDVVTTDSARERAAEFALHVEDLVVRGRLDLDLLRARMKTSVAAEVETWFDGLATPSLKYLAIAAALLDGLPYQTVIEPAGSLERRLSPAPSSVAPAAVPADPFATGRAHRVREIRAQIVRATVPSRLGPVPAEVVRYLDPAYPRAVLDLVWREYDAVRGELLGWLGDLANHPVDAVRVRAAAAIGLISTTAFDYISKTVLRPWAGDDKENKREMAAFALRAAGRSPQLRQQALALVDEWVTGRSWQRHATAARVYGSALGATLPKRAFHELDRLSVTEDADVAFAIGYSLAELIDADHRHALPATSMAVRWMGSGHQGQSATGQIAFLTLAADLVGISDGGQGAWPLLLRLASRDFALKHSLSEAWHVTLNGAMFHQYAQSIAGAWAELVEPGDEARQAWALVLATAAAGHERTYKIVRWMAGNWMTGTGPVRAPRTGQAVLAALGPTREFR